MDAVKLQSCCFLLVTFTESNEVKEEEYLTRVKTLFPAAKSSRMLRKNATPW